MQRPHANPLRPAAQAGPLQDLQLEHPELRGRQPGPLRHHAPGHRPPEEDESHGRKRQGLRRRPIPARDPLLPQERDEASADEARCEKPPARPTLRREASADATQPGEETREAFPRTEASRPEKRLLAAAPAPSANPRKGASVPSAEECHFAQASDDEEATGVEKLRHSEAPAEEAHCCRALQSHHAEASEVSAR